MECYLVQWGQSVWQQHLTFRANVFQLEIETTFKADSRGTVALDDFNTWAGSCGRSLLDCDFERTACGWKDNETYPLQWSRVLAEEGAEVMGFDHTTNTQTGQISRKKKKIPMMWQL